MTSWLNLEHKTVIVTGGASGLGAKTVSSIVECGAAVFVFDLHAGHSVAGVEYVECDVTDRAEVERATKQVVASAGKIDALVNFAGVNRPALLVDYYGGDREREASDADFDLQVAVNQKGPFLCAQAAARVMVEQGSGVIVNVTSEAGAEGSVGQSLYAGTKGGLNAFTLSWAKELGRFNIRVVGVAPAINVPTPMGNAEHYAALAYTRGKKPEDVTTDYSARIPLGRPGEHQEIADAVTYLISERASYVTGTIVAVTGGKSRG